MEIEKPRNAWTEIYRYACGGADSEGISGSVSLRGESAPFMDLDR
jgi:hypothetical protein